MSPAKNQCQLVGAQPFWAKRFSLQALISESSFSVSRDKDFSVLWPLLFWNSVCGPGWLWSLKHSPASPSQDLVWKAWATTACWLLSLIDKQKENLNLNLHIGTAWSQDCGTRNSARPQPEWLPMCWLRLFGEQQAIKKIVHSFVANKPREIHQIWVWG